MGQTNFVLMIMYDVPVNQKKEQQTYRKFNSFLQKSGFYLLQNSIYIKPLSEKQANQKYINKIKELVTDLGHIRALTLTYQQFLAIELVIGDDTWGEKLIKTNNSVLAI
ncbi:CRISPR-associated endonuclease Cas2 [Orbus wheelerorum]|uniref:CRISPR-associated endonuclease Cas2 n=1 Tax=Orbus wheelerorum TaxID=3074111 RepID=UPI00370D9AB5